MQIAEAFVAIRPQADPAEFARAVDQAVGRTRPTVVVDADTDQAQAEIRGLDAAPVSVPVDADTTGAQGEIAGIDAPPIVVPVDVDTDEAEQKIESFGDTARRAAVTFASAIGTAKFGSFVADMTRGAAELEAAVGGTAAIFQEAGATIDEFAVGAAESAGLSERAARQLTTTIGSLLRGAGFAADEAADASIKIAQLGADLSALTGAGTAAEAVEALAATMRGEFDTAERFGISLSAAAVQAKALELGLADSESEITNQAKAQATLALLMERGALAQGTFAREANTAAGAAQISAAQTANAADSVGENFLPIYREASQVVGLLAGAFGALPGPLQVATLGLVGLGVAAPIIANVAGAVRGLVATLSAQRLASAASNIGGAFAALVGPQAALVAGTAALTAGFLNARQNAEQFRREMRALGEDLAEGGDAAEAAARKLEGIVGPNVVRELQDYADALIAGNDSADEHAAAAQRAAIEESSWGGELFKTTQAAASAKDGVDDYLESLGDASRLSADARIAQEAYANALADGGKTEKELADLRRDVVDTAREDAEVRERVAAASREGADAAREGAGANKEYGDSQKRSAEDTEKARQAILDWTDAVLSGINEVNNLRAGELDLLDQQDRVIQAMQDAAEATDDSTTAVNEKAAAERDAEQASLALSDAVLKTAQDEAARREGLRILNGETITAKTKQDDLRGALEQLASKAGPGSPLATAIEAHLVRLAAIPPAKHTNVTAETAQAEAAIQRVLDKLGQITTNLVFGVIGDIFPFGGNARGGSLQEGFSLINEEGPELLHKRGSRVEVLSAGNTRQAIGIPGRQVNVSNTYHLQVPDTPTETALEAIKRRESWDLQRIGRRA